MTTNNLIQGGDVWKSIIRHRLSEGYGVEDIAIRLKCHPSRVRKYVGELRDAGRLWNILHPTKIDPKVVKEFKAKPAPERKAILDAIRKDL